MMTEIFGHHGIGDRVHHLGAGADDAAPLGVAAHHEAVYVVQENQRNQVLVAVHDEARGLVGALGINDAAELDRRRLPWWSVCCTCFFWLATIPTA